MSHACGRIFDYNMSPAGSFTLNVQLELVGCLMHAQEHSITVSPVSLYTC